MLSNSPSPTHRRQSAGADGPDNLIVPRLDCFAEAGWRGAGGDGPSDEANSLAAGMAGAQPDAAAALAAANEAWDCTGRVAARLAVVAATLGSDIPFFFAAPHAPVGDAASGSNLRELACISSSVAPAPADCRLADVYRLRQARGRAATLRDLIVA